MNMGNLTTATIGRSRALFQGDPAAPFLFNHTLGQPLYEMEQACQKKKWGMPLHDSSGIYYLSIIAFADNYWIFSISPSALQSMSIVLVKIAERGWMVYPPDEITYATTALDHDYCRDIIIDNHIIQRAPRKTGFKVLGTQNTFDNYHDVELTRRVAAAWCAWSRYKTLLTCKAIPLELRLSMLTRAINPALFLCAGSWNLRANQLTTLRELQRKMIRRMLGFQYLQGEDIEGFMRRTNRIISNVIARHGVMTWEYMAHRNLFRFAGFIARTCGKDPLRITSRVFRHKDWNWIQ